MKRKTANNNNNNKKYRLAMQLSAAHTHKSYISNFRAHTKKQKQTIPKPEHCSNPWKPDCSNPDIALDIEHHGKRRPVCRKCWERISRSKHQW